MWTAWGLVVSLAWAGARADTPQASLEDEFDALRERVAELDAADADLTAATLELERFAREAERAGDDAQVAYALSLLARLEAREFEDGATDTRRAERLASESLVKFDAAGYRLPKVEPHWVLARVTFARDELERADRHFAAMAELASDESYAEWPEVLAWRERGVLGRIAVARESGDLELAGEHLRELASFRDPSECWSLAREVAVQLLSNDEPDRATRWLARYGPSDDDDEIARSVEDGDPWEAAAIEWRTLLGAAEIRAGRPTAASRTLEELGTNGEPSEVLRLARIALAIETGGATQALVDLRATDATSALGRVEAWTLEGRALLALGRASEAIAPLERALDEARERDRVAALRSDGSTTASRVGEWLGLSAVQWLARARAESGDALGAAATIEAAIARIDDDEAERRLREIAASTSLGVVTWIVGADETLAVHVMPDGTASAHVVERGRRSLRRAVERSRGAVLGHAPTSYLDGAAEELLPPSLTEALARADAPGGGTELVLFPHGPLERLPFEALPVVRLGQSQPFGSAVAFEVGDRLRTERDPVAPSFDPGRTPWVACGAPSNGELADLPAAAVELSALESLHPRMATVRGDAFEREALERALQGSRALHLATHFGARSVGASPAIELSGGERMTSHEVARLAPRLPLVVLNACASQDGRTVEGRGTHGLARAFLDGGTPVVVATLFPIDDDDAYRGSTVLHAALLSGASVAEAARRARSLVTRTGARTSTLRVTVRR